MERTLGRRVFENGERLRAGWRIAVYLVLFFLFYVVGQLAASVLPRAALTWAGLVVGAGAALAAGWIVLSRLDGRPLGALGFPLARSALSETAAGLLVGGGLIGITVVLLLATGTARFVPDSGTLPGYLLTLLWALAFFWVAAAAEELLFRGYAFQAMVEALGAWPAVLVSSALFSWAHAQNPNIDAAGFANIFLAGVLLAIAYLRTRSLWFATAVHLGWNWVMAALLDFPVSGLTAFETPLYSAVEVGADWWTGGDFGPEAGLAGTIALVAGGIWLLRTPLVSESAVMRALGPIVDRKL